MDKATQGVLTIAKSVLEQLDLEVVLERVLDAARDLSDARYAALGVLDESRNQLARFLTIGVDDATRKRIGPLPICCKVSTSLLPVRRLKSSLPMPGLN